MRIAILLPVLLLAVGCARVKTNLHQPVGALPADKGVVVFSTGANEGSYTSVVALRLESVSRTGETSDGETDIMVNRGYDTSDFKDEHGQVRLAVLDEGSYCLYPRHTNPYVRLTGTLPHYAFRVKKGTVTYVGSIFMNGTAFSVRDRQKRDMDAALAAHPELASLPATVTPAARHAECSSRQ
jgi:hypothetical protein